MNTIHRYGFAFLLLCLVSAVQADAFLQPQVLPEELKSINFEDSKTGQAFPVHLDENHLPISSDFTAEGVSIPFTIEGQLIESSSGSQLHAWEVIPDENANGISVLVLHGNGGNILSNLGSGIALSKKGFRTLIVDYSGYGWSTGDANRKNVLQDGLSWLERWSQQALARGDQRIVFGQSLGGHLAVVVAAQNPDWLDALVIEGAFSSHKAIAATHKGSLAKAFVREYYSAEESIPSYTKPLLVIHSTDDEIVPYSHGETLFGLANDPKTFLEIDGPHLAGLSQDLDQISRRMLELLE